ncbi:MAG: LEA type 2 family protein [Methanomicrobiaceae archaeon]|nr:LEA type 2 family protein [Methanomicrobiaceae archaeon]
MQETSEPSIEIAGAGIEGVGIEATTLNVAIVVKNPLPFGGNIESLEYRIFLVRDGEEVFLGEGRKGNIRIEKSQATRTEVPVKLKNTAILSAAGGLIGSDIDIVIRGTAAIDLTVATPAIPFEKKVKIEGFLKSLKN